MIRLSSYAILSEPLPGGGYVLMSGCSGAIDLISDTVATSLMTHGGFRAAQGLPSSISPHCNPAPTSSREPDANLVNPPADKGRPTLEPELVNYFLERGHLTRLSHEQERKHVKRVAQLLHEAQRGHPVFMIVPTFECNYRCTYCFERPLQNGLIQLDTPVNHRRQNVVMTLEHIEPVYKSIRQIQRDADAIRPGGQIVLYGGEPLDGDNVQVVTAIVRRGAEEGFEFAAISNGHDWDQYMHLMGDGGLTQVQVSIDGPKHIHDRRRIYRKGGSSFEKIVSNVQAVISKGGTLVQVRVHVDPSNIHLFSEVIEVCRRQCWLNNRSVVIYANTVYSKNKKNGHVSAQIE